MKRAPLNDQLRGVLSRDQILFLEEIAQDLANLVYAKEFKIRSAKELHMPLNQGNMVRFGETHSIQDEELLKVVYSVVYGKAV